MKNPIKKINCAIYTRVSTDNQAEKEYNSCETQEERIKSFVESQENLEVYKVYSDPGYSGASLERPALNDLMQDVSNGKVNCILTYKIRMSMSRSKASSLPKWPL